LEWNVNRLFVALIFVYLLIGIVYTLRGYFSSSLASEYMNLWRLNLLKTVLEAKNEFYNSKNIKDIQSSFNQEVSTLAAGFFEFQVIINTIIITLIYISICLVISAGVTLSIIFIGLSVLFFSRKSLVISYSDNKEYINQVSIFLSESMNLIQNINYVKATNSENYFYRRLESITFNLKKYYTKILLRPIVQKSIMESIGVVIFIFILYTMLVLLNISYLELGVILIIFLRLFPRLVSFNNSIFSLTASSSVLNKNNLLLSELGNFRELNIFQQSNNHFNFKKIFISDLNIIRNNRKVLSRVNLEFNFGEFIGIFGHSGSGKTTIINSILGLVDSSPIISIDNGNLLSHSQAINLRSNIGYVSQDDFFMIGSIKDNILWGLNYDQKRFDEVLKVVGLNIIINKLPLGLDTEVGGSGFILSGGEKQKVALARALYRDPKILILDEATSALDRQSEAELMNSVYSLRNKLSCIIISHGYRNLWGCDNIYIIENGTIINSGPWSTFK
jgi:ATP-binding cassette subfamily C protein